MLKRAALLAAVLLSGAAALMYQAAWARRLTTLTNASVTAQAIVLATFMAGLGLGALAAGRRAAGRLRPAADYAVLEIVAAALAVLSFPAISASDVVPTTLHRIGVPLFAGLWVQFALAAVLLMVPTTLLGATLPLLVEHLELNNAQPTKARRSRVVAALYGFNTAGAVVGSALSGFVTIERYGLSRTAWIGAFLSVCAAALALVSARSAGPRLAPAPHLNGTGVERRLLLAAGFAGFIALACEILWIRLYSLVVPNTVYAFSEVTIAVLAGIAAGAALAVVLTPTLCRARDPAQAIVTLAGFMAALSAVAVALVPHLVLYFARDVPTYESLAQGNPTVRGAILLFFLALAATALATLLPLLITASNADRSSAVVGDLYAANTAGCVAGSLFMGFVLIPLLGIKRSNMVLELACLSLALLLLSGIIGRFKTAALLGTAGLTAALLNGSHNIPLEIYERHVPPKLVVRDFHEGVASHVMVTDEQGTGVRQLWINSIWVAGTAGPHRAIGFLPGLLVSEPRRALGIGLGTGQSFASVLRHGVSRLDCVEIDRGVIDISTRWFRDANQSLFDDPRVSVYTDDGRAFLRAHRSGYDLIVLEPLQAWSSGTSNLYSREFYQEARSNLSPDGVLSQWIPFYGQGVEETKTMVRTGLEVMGHGLLWLTSNDGILILSQRPLELDPDVLQRRIVTRHLADELERFPARDASDLLNYLLLGERGLERWSAGAKILEDDRPFLEFRAAGRFGVGGMNSTEILRSVEPYLEDFSPIADGLAPWAGRRVLAAQAIRDALVSVQLLPAGAFRDQVRLLERVPIEQRGSPLWELMYRSTIADWLDSPEIRNGGEDARQSLLRRAEQELARSNPRAGPER